MKKWLLLILTVCFSVLALLTAWYADFLTNRIYFFAFVIFAVQFSELIALLVLDIVFFVKSRNFRHLISLGILVLLAVFCFCFPFRDAKIRHDLNAYENQMTEVAEKIRADEWQPLYGNIISLPLEYRYLSDGEVYDYYHNADEQVLGFYVFRGMLCPSIELIYSTGGEELIRAHTQRFEIIEIEELQENWYYVEIE